MREPSGSSGPEGRLKDSIGKSRAEAIAPASPDEGCIEPDSIWEMVEGVAPDNSASRVCVSRRSLRTCRTRSPFTCSLLYLVMLEDLEGRSPAAKTGHDQVPPDL